MTRTVAISTLLAAALSGCGDETCMCWGIQTIRVAPPELPEAGRYTDEFPVSDAQEYFLADLPVPDSIEVEGVTADGGVFALDGWAYDRRRNSVTLEAPLDVETILASYDPADAVY